MAYYIVEMNKKIYASFSLARDMFGMSDMDLFLTTTRKDGRKIKEILDSTMIEISEEEVAKARRMFSDITTQNIDTALNAIKKTEHANPIPHGSGEVISFDKYKFVRLCELKYSDKYNKRSKIPHIKVCGSIYVALDSVFVGKEKESVVFTAKERT